MQTLTEGAQCGDYVLGKLLATGEFTSTHEAVQTSVQRDVTITLLQPQHGENDDIRSAFLADVRTKAMVEHPVLGSVLEAIDTSDYCLFAQEKLPGQSLAQCQLHGESLSPLETVRLLRSLAEAYLHLEDHAIASLAMETADVFLDAQRNARIVNLAVAGDPDPAVHIQDKHTLGTALADLLTPDLPGSTRVRSLLGYMSDTQRQHPLSWQQVHDLSDEVERQLAETATTPQITSPTMSMGKKLPAALIGKIAAALILITLIGYVIHHFANRPSAPETRELADMIRIPAGTYPGPDGRPIKVREFWIDAHEVTIGEYAEFLDDLNALSEENRNVYQHENQPADKTSHLPDDWENLYQAALEGSTWNSLEIDLNCPVVGIDWWDAYAYAEWKGRRLPSREQWYAACSSGADPTKLKASGWSPVDLTSQTKLGVFGLAGNVMEWTREATLDPADLSKPRRHILCGASYLRPQHGVKAREWVDSRMLRRPDIGFRTFSFSR